MANWSGVEYSTSVATTRMLKHRYNIRNDIIQTVPRYNKSKTLSSTNSYSTGMGPAVLDAWMDIYGDVQYSIADKMKEDVTLTIT